jgi:RNA polymerase sigma factor (sigma-70 family)
MAEGFLGVMIAAGKFDPQAGTKFTTYAAWWIRQSCTRAVENDDQTIRVPTHVHTDASKAYKGQTLTPEKLARVQAATAMRRPMSLDAPAGHAEGAAAIGDLIPAPGAAADEILADEHRAAWVEQKIADIRPKLSDRKRAILDRRLLGGETLEQLGQSFGLSRERVRQLEVELVRQLRVHLADDEPTPARLASR